MSLVTINFAADTVGIQNTLEQIMSKVEELKAAVQKLQDAAVKGLAEVAKDVQALKDKINNGDNPTTAELDAVITNINAVADTLASVDPIPES